MRYSRLVPNIEKGGVVKSRVIRSKPKATRTRKATKAATKSARKRKNRIDDSSESAVSSDDDGRESESEVKSKDEDVVSLPKLRTRGIKRLMRETSSSDSEDSLDDVSDSDIDDYKPTGEEAADDEDDLSNMEETPKRRVKSDSNDEAGRDRRSGTPPVTPGRFTDTTKHTLLLITPPGSDEKQSKFTSTITSPTRVALKYDDQIKQDLSSLKAGMMMPLSNSSSTVASFQAVSAPSPAYAKMIIQESDIAESIERDSEEVFAGAEKDNQESENEDQDGGIEDRDIEDGEEDKKEDVSEIAAENLVMGSPAALPSKVKKFFSWM